MEGLIILARRKRIEILTVVGARPQFIKAAMVSAAIDRHGREQEPEIAEKIVHTGQHYDHEMSRIFFDEMGIPKPAVNLGVGSGSHAETTGSMMVGVEAEIISQKPDLVLVYGDTNSTLAGAMAAAKLDVPDAHVEAGLRSFNRRMPEEINRILTDRVSTLLLCPTLRAVENLAAEGITDGVHHTGDVMYDAALAFGEIAMRESRILSREKLTPKRYYLVTVHRAENTDDPARLRGILDGLRELARELPVVLPLHPRTRKAIAAHGFEKLCEGIRILQPVSYLDMVRLEKDATVILTDSGGIQKEAYFHGVPCVTLRDETEWVETVEQGWNLTVGADPKRIADAARQAGTGKQIEEYGNGSAAAVVLSCIQASLLTDH